MDSYLNSWSLGAMSAYFTEAFLPRFSITRPAPYSTLPLSYAPFIASKLNPAYVFN
jgi:hypothetical protein